jgi:hypothetical protein
MHAPPLQPCSKKCGFNFRTVQESTLHLATNLIVSYLTYDPVHHVPSRVNVDQHTKIQRRLHASIHQQSN